ncbi:MAG TPA: Calx-beta domain-containing protein [Thermoanaerobaculia bacterium]|jgi:hypothetical protein
MNYPLLCRRFGVLFLTLFAVPAVFAATFTVTDGGDDGPGTLRQAIVSANATPGRDQIVLATDVVITTGLPTITDAIDITGARTPAGRYRIDTNFISLGDDVLTFVAGSAGSTVRSIVLGNAGLDSPLTITTSNVTVTDIVTAERVFVTGTDNAIGGPATADANQIGILDIFGAGNVVIRTTAQEVNVFGADDAQIGTVAAGNTIGLLTVQQADGVTIRNNTLFGVRIFDIVAPDSGPALLGNVIDSFVGVELTNVNGALIENNTIRTTGIQVISSTGIDIRRNAITVDGLAIDLGDNGPTPNDAAPDADGGANGLQNYPVLTSASLTAGALTVTGTLTSAPLTPYEIEIFSDEDWNPDARTFIGAFNVTTNAAGIATFSETFTTLLPTPDEVIASTATNRGTVGSPGNAPNSTSEVSAAIAVTQPGTVAFQTATRTVDEAAGTVSITVTRTGGSEGTVTVDYTTANGTATAPGDFTQTSGTLTFGPGVTTQTIVVPLTNNDAAEANETFTVTLTNPTGGATLGQSTTTITITDTDAAVDAAPVPTASTWALMAMALCLALIALFRS